MRQQTGAISDELLTQGARRQVPPRDGSLVSRGTALTAAPESPTAGVAAEPQAALPNTRSTNASLRDNLQAALDGYPRTSQKALHIRLAESLQEPFVTDCRQHGCTPETFLEAVILLLETDPHLKQRIAANAQSIYQKRQRAGRLRRTKADLEKS